METREWDGLRFKELEHVLGEKPDPFFLDMLYAAFPSHAEKAAPSGEFCAQFDLLKRNRRDDIRDNGPN